LESPTDTSYVLTQKARGLFRAAGTRGAIQLESFGRFRSRDRRSAKETLMAQTRILMVLTSNGRMGLNGGETGLWVETFATPFYALENLGMSPEVATVKGGAPAIDPKSVAGDALGDNAKRFMDDARLREGLKAAPALRDVQTSLYDAMLLCGGAGALWEFPASPELVVALEQFALQGKPIAAIGHGAAALVPVMDKRSQPLTRGRKVACSSSEEDAAAGLAGVAPFMLENKLRDLGAEIAPAAAGAPHVCVDEFLITGQNAASSAGVTDALVEVLRGERIAA
jgi:putative intracellular protease/amidase